jgi:hypothetical protein
MACDAMRVSDAGTDSFWVATPQKLGGKSLSTRRQRTTETLPQSITVSSSWILLP